MQAYHDKSSTDTSVTTSATPDRMRKFIEDILIRLGGTVLIALSVTTIRLLYRDIHMGGSTIATIGQYLEAAVGFLSASIGCGLVTLGAHIHDRIELSERWQRRI